MSKPVDEEAGPQAAHVFLTSEYRLTGFRQQTLQPQSPPDVSARTAVSLRARNLLAEAYAVGPPAPADWDQVFQSDQYSSEVIAEAMQQLHQKKQFDAAVEFMLASIRNDHAQPWTYDVLAIEMKLAGRPADQIERVLQSRSDFTAGDVGQTMLTAAMLARFNAFDRALEVCRIAAETAPRLAEVWLQARSIADRSHSPLDQIWARCGVLQHVWIGDYEAEHAEAVSEIQRITAQLERSGNAAAASKAREDLQQARQVDLRIIVEWVGEADIDLIVDEPGGEQCRFESRLTSNGGRLVRTDTGKSGGNKGRSREEYVCVNAPPGTYAARIRFIYGKVVNGTAVVQVIHNQNSPQQKSSKISTPLSRQDSVIEIQVPATPSH